MKAVVAILLTILILPLARSTETLVCAQSKDDPPRPGTGIGQIVPPRPGTDIGKIVKPEVKPRFGTLTVASEKGALISIARRGAVKNVQPLKIGAAGEQAVFNDLQPGEYRISAELDGYESQDEVRKIAPNVLTAMTLGLKRISYPVTIKTNVGRAEVLYRLEGADRETIGQIENGLARLDLYPGKYLITIRPLEVVYLPRSETITVGKENPTFEFKLKYIESTTAFSDRWQNLDRWEAPPGWRTASGLLFVAGRGAALPRDENHRYYLDAELVASVHITRGAATFVFRAQDQQNHYFVRIAVLEGKRGELQLGVVKGGQEQILRREATINTMPEGILNRDLEVTVSMKDNRLSVEIKDGDDYAKAALDDPAKTFQIGAVGIAAREGEETKIERFIVRPLSVAKTSELR